MNNRWNTNNKKLPALLAFIIVSTLSGCFDNGNTDDGSTSNNEEQSPPSTDSSEAEANAKALNEALRTMILEKGLTGKPTEGRNLPDIEEPLPQLGMKLFFTKALSGEKDTACVSCHHPMLGGGDDLSLSVGVDAEVTDLLGSGRFHRMDGEHHDGGPTVPRNSPSIFNIALYDEVLFHDGRVESLGKTKGKNGNDGQGIRTPDVRFGEADPNAGVNLSEAQARFPITSPEEMRNFGPLLRENNNALRGILAQRVGNYGDSINGALEHNEWLPEFQKGFNQPNATAEEVITYDNIAKAIAAYENSQIFVDIPWNQYILGDNEAISEEAKQGALVFYNSVEEGGANCGSCHSGDFFTDEQFHNIGMPQIGRGKGNGEKGNEDFGRFRETRNEDDKYAFRTPHLLNVTATGPWGHAGAYTTLENVVRHHLNPQKALNNYDWLQLDSNIQATYMVENTQKALDKLSADREAGKPCLDPVDLSEESIQHLIAFLHALTDPCVESRECLSPWILGADDTNPDRLRVNAVDSTGTLL